MKRHFTIRTGVFLALVSITASAAVYAQAQKPAAPAAATPRLANGQPDLSGLWVTRGGGGGGGREYRPDERGNVYANSTFRPCHPGSECRPAANSERDAGLRQRLFGATYNVPQYRPEFWDRVQDMDVNGGKRDMTARCYPEGVPRVGAPDKIMQSATEVAFLYEGHNRFRIIPTDGRPHDPDRAQGVNWDGEPSGRWEGDTLVIESVGFTDESWLHWAGFFHTNNMRVVERVRREGDVLIWQATVHDPEVLLEPWEMPAVRRRLNPDPKARLLEDPPCDEQDLEHMATRERG